jgi:hypothetical protein
MRLRRLSGETSLATQKDPDFLAVSVPSIVKAIARARDWYERIVSGKVSTIKQLSKESRVDPAYVKRTFPVALLSPTVTESLLEGRHGSDISLQHLMCTFSPIWGEQPQATIAFNEDEEHRS